MLLEAKDLTFAYEEREGNIFNHVNLTIESHDRVALMGPSGFGKTTLCKVLAGYLQPDRGQVLLDGKPLPKRGYCPVQMIWQHPERAVNPRLKMKEVLLDGRGVEGRIIQELPTNILHQYTDWDQVHPSHALPGTVLQKLYGSDFPVNSAHHQGIGSPGRDLFIIQYAPDDVPEAIIHKTLPILGVQWHPERMCFEHRRTDTPDGSLLLAYFLSLIP